MKGHRCERTRVKDHSQSPGGWNLHISHSHSPHLGLLIDFIHQAPFVNTLSEFTLSGIFQTPKENLETLMTKRRFPQCRAGVSSAFGGNKSHDVNVWKLFGEAVLSVIGVSGVETMIAVIRRDRKEGLGGDG